MGEIVRFFEVVGRKPIPQIITRHFMPSLIKLPTPNLVQSKAFNKFFRGVMVWLATKYFYIISCGSVTFPEACGGANFCY